MRYTARQYAAALRGALSDIPGEQHTTILNRFFAALRRQKQLRLLPTIIEAYERILLDESGTIPVHMTTAREHPVSSITNTLRDALHHPIALTHEHDASLVGGAVVTINGDTRIDGSLRGALAALRMHLTQSSSTK